MEKSKKLFAKEWHFSFVTQLEKIVARFSRIEKIFFYGITAVFLASGLTLLYKVNANFLVEIPATGGALTEGVIGTPRFVNPLLAISDADRDLTALLYAGLLKATPEGNLVPDLAKNYTISDSGLVYTFTLKDKIFFHDGTPVSADDVVFTIQKAQDPALKSPKRANWDGIAVEKVDGKTVRLTLKQAYAPFLENATMGILPKHLWHNVSADEFAFSRGNIAPVGAGAFRIGEVRTAGGTEAPTYFDLVPFTKYALGAPHLAHLVLRFYGNETALLSAYRNGEVESVNTIAPEEAKKLAARSVRIERSPLPRVFGIFFNQNQSSVLANKEVRTALARVLDKGSIVDGVLAGYGTVIDGPIPPGLVGNNIDTTTDEWNATTTTARKQSARKILEKAGWQWNTAKGVMEKKMGKKDTVPLTFSLTTASTPELARAAEMIKSAWESVGAKVELKIFETGDLNQNVIRTRKYDALFFGEIVGRNPDLFAFWHSSQRNDPGLNIALYTNIKVDKLLEQARTTSDRETRNETYKKFEAEINKDIPTVFVYAPDFLYVLPHGLKGVKIGNVTTPSERFLNVNEWFIETEKVWRIFL